MVTAVGLEPTTFPPPTNTVLQKLLMD